MTFLEHLSEIKALEKKATSGPYINIKMQYEVNRHGEGDPLNPVFVSDFDDPESQLYAKVRHLIPELILKFEVLAHFASGHLEGLMRVASSQCFFDTYGGGPDDYCSHCEAEHKLKELQTILEIVKEKS